MRLSSNSSSTRARSVLRRDWRSSPDSPEVDRRSSYHPSPRQCPKGTEHVPELVEVERRATTEREGSQTFETTLIRSKVRCANCHETNLDPALCARFADHLSSSDLSRLLGAFWCHRGHLYEQAVDDEVRTSRWFDRRRLSSPLPFITACAMCGRIKNDRAGRRAVGIRSLDILVGAGIPEDVAGRVSAHPTPRWAANGVLVTKVGLSRN